MKAAGVKINATFGTGDDETVKSMELDDTGVTVAAKQADGSTAGTALGSAAATTDKSILFSVVIDGVTKTQSVAITVN